MRYVFDTSAFVVLENYYPSTFKKLWAELDSMAWSGALESVKEVFNELQNYGGGNHVEDWATRNKAIFAKPSNGELLVVQQILSIPHFQTIIGQKPQLKGTPVADPFVVAAAKVKESMVVTQERFKSNAAKIPNVCDRFGVPCVTLEEFMLRQGWSF